MEHRFLASLRNDTKLNSSTASESDIPQRSYKSLYMYFYDKHTLLSIFKVKDPVLHYIAIKKWNATDIILFLDIIPLTRGRLFHIFLHADRQKHTVIEKRRYDRTVNITKYYT